jgi:hypothetical protein
LIERISQLDLADPGLWLAASLAVVIVAANLGWAILRTRPGGRLAGIGVLAPLGWLIKSLFLLLIPIGAWQYGALSPYLMGLSETDWIQVLAAGGALAVLIVGVTLFGWLTYRHTPLSIALTDLTWPSAWRTPLDAALLQWHWAFYRAATIGWLASGPGQGAGASILRALSVPEQAFYWGSWLGLLLVGLEGTLNPFFRRALRSPGSGELGLLRVALAVASTALFILTRNFWLSLACHVTVETAIVGWFRPRTIETSRG